MRINDKRQALGVRPLVEQTVPWSQPEHGEAEIEAVRRVLSAGSWGHESREFERVERKFAEVQGLLDSHAVIAVANGTVAIQLGLEALDIGAGDEVITTGLTWEATADAILSVNAVPVLLDVDPNTWTLDPGRVEEYFVKCREEGRPLPKAVIAVHLYRWAADVERLLSVCRRYGVFLIEDAAHAHGGEWRGSALGSFGVFSTFSTEGSKALASGEGGFVVTGVPQLERRLRSLRSCGRRITDSTIDPSARVDEITAGWIDQVEGLGLSDWPIQSGNYRMSAIVAALLGAQLERFPAQHEQRAQALVELEQRLRGVRGIRSLTWQAQLTAPVAYMFAFELDSNAFAGMDAGLFREVLSYLIGGHPVTAPYDPLGGGPTGYRSPVYNPQTKRRFRVSPSYWERIDPSRFDLRMVHGVFNRGVCIGHTALREPGFPDTLVEAIDWIRSNAERIVAAGA